MSQTRPTTEGLKTEMREVADELQKLASEVRLKLHLASMEAKASWAEFEPRLIDFGQRVERSAGEVSEDVRTLAGELKERLKDFRNRVAR